MLFSKRKRVIKRAVAKTVAAFAERTPKIYLHFFYGNFDDESRSLTIWYLFETDDELVSARESGLCREIEQLTVKNLISLGYPCEAFETIQAYVSSDKIVFDGVSEKDGEKALLSLAASKASVSFASQQDIDAKTNGDYHLYFQ